MPVFRWTILAGPLHRLLRSPSGIGTVALGSDMDNTPLYRLFLLFFFYMLPIVVVAQMLSSVRLFVTPWAAAHQASLSFNISRSLLKLMSIESVIPSNRLVLCPSLLLPSILPSIRVCLQSGRPRLDPWVGKISRRRAWQHTPLFLPGESSCIEETGKLQSMRSQRVRHNWVTTVLGDFLVPQMVKNLLPVVASKINHIQLIISHHVSGLNCFVNELWLSGKDSICLMTVES